MLRSILLYDKTNRNTSDIITDAINGTKRPHAGQTDPIRPITPFRKARNAARKPSEKVELNKTTTKQNPDTA